jgi:hypothetical protein
VGYRLRFGCSAAFSRALPVVAALLLLGAKPATAGSSLVAVSDGPDTFWLVFTNIVLGLATLEACLWVAWGIVQEVVFRRRLRRLAVTASRGILVLVTIALVPRPVGATVEMQKQAKKLGLEVRNCLHCHASPHAVDTMKEKAKGAGMAEGNCVACHGADIPITLNQRGHWLVAEKARRAAKEFDMAWLRDYTERAPKPKPAGPKAPTAKPGAEPETIPLAPKSER